MEAIHEENYEEIVTKEILAIKEKDYRKGYSKSDESTSLFYEIFKNPKAHGSIVISHGFCEFTEKYEEVILRFYHAGYSVFIFDYRGHGRSTRNVQDLSMVHVDSYTEYVRDLHGFTLQIARPESEGLPLYLYAHSMGGAIAALYLEQFPDSFDKAVLTSPMLEMESGFKYNKAVCLMALFYKLTGRAKSYVRGHKEFSGIPEFKRSGCTSEACYDHIFKKRLLTKEHQTNGASCGWVYASLMATSKLQREAKKVKIPVLLFQAGEETMVRNSGQVRFAKKAANVELFEIKESRHEIYNALDSVKEPYFEKIYSFFTK